MRYAPTNTNLAEPGNKFLICIHFYPLILKNVSLAEEMNNTLLESQTLNPASFIILSLNPFV